MAAGLRRARVPLVTIGIVGGIAAAWLAHWLMRPYLYYLMVDARPAILFFWLWYFTPVAFVLGFLLLAFVFGAVQLPRHADFKPSVRLRWLHAPVLVLALLGLPGSFIAARRQSRVQPLPDIIEGKWAPGPEPLTVEAFDMHLPPPRGGLIPQPETFSRGGYLNLRDDEVQRLRSAGVTGHIKVVSGQTGVTDSRAIIIMYQKPDAPFSFLLPGRHTDVIYLQTPEGWLKLPPDAGESDRRIHVSAVAGTEDWQPAIQW